MNGRVAGGGAAVLIAVLLASGQPAGGAPAPESGTPQQWSVSSGAPPGVLTSVSCPTAKRCFAIGRSNDGEPVATTWNGRRWWTTHIVSGSGSSLSSVSCASASHCVAVGRYNDGSRWRPLVTTWFGDGWGASRGSGRVTGFSGVSCVSTTTCIAIGTSSGRARVEMTSDSYWWRPLPLPRLPLGATQRLRGIDCVSATFCVAVGSVKPSATRSTQTLAMMWDGTAWSSAPRPRLPFSDGGTLNAVSCLSPVSCFAVGRNNSFGTLIERWDGSRWEVVPSVDSWYKYFSTELTGVSCVSPVSCVAVGTAETGSLRPGRQWKAIIETWDGTAWSLTTPPPRGDMDRNSLAGVSCTSEHCAAVGSYESSAAPTHSLAVSGNVAPRSVRVAWSAGDNARLLQIAAYLGQSPAATQKAAVHALAYVLGFGSHRPTPLTLPPAGTATRHTTVWEPSELATIDSVRAQYGLDSAAATRVSVAFLSYVLALGGH